MGIRAIVERLSRGKIIRRSIQVKGKTVTIFVSPDAQLKYLKPSKFDTDLIGIAEKHLDKSSIIWDVGANIGVFTFAASSIATEGSVLAIEADTWLTELMRKTAKHGTHKEKDISILPAAISNVNSVASFIVAERGRASNALESAGGRSQMGGIRARQFVATLTLDTLLDTFPPPSFIKIDIEGAELQALEGAEKVINAVRPTFYIEVGENVSIEILNLFTSAGYSAFDPSGKALVAKCSTNTLFVPH